jgi:hypothetical protein
MRVASRLTSLSMSHSRLESVVSSMASRIGSVYQRHNDLDQELEDVHCMVQSPRVTNASAQSPPIPVRNPARSPTIEAANPLYPNSMSISTLATSPRPLDMRTSNPKPPQYSNAPFIPESPSRKPSANIRVSSSPTETMSTSRASSPTQTRNSEFSISVSSFRYSNSSYASSTASSGGWSSPETPLVGHQPSTTGKRNLPLPVTPEAREPDEGSGEHGVPFIPPPALGYAVDSVVERPKPRSTLSQYPAIQSDIVKLHRSSTTASQKATFEKEAFRNSAVLCDV